MKTWRNIWGAVALGAMIGTLCGYNWALIIAAISALMCVACANESEEAEEEDAL